MVRKLKKQIEKAERYKIPNISALMQPIAMRGSTVRIGDNDE